VLIIFLATSKHWDRWHHGLSSNWSIKQGATPSRHWYIVEVGLQLQAVSAFAWGKSYQ
jgi:hypothetical protein